MERSKTCQKQALVTRAQHKGDTIDIYDAQDGHTNVTQIWNFAIPSGNVLACQRFCRYTRCCCRTLNNSPGDNTMAHDAFTNGPMALQLQPNLKKSIIVLPSAVKGGVALRDVSWYRQNLFILCVWLALGTPLAHISALESKLRRKCGNDAEKLRKASTSTYPPQNNDIGLRRICEKLGEKMRKIKLWHFKAVKKMRK